VARARRVLHRWDEPLRTAIVVASLATLAAHHLGWVRAIDGYAFAMIGNLTTLRADDGTRGPENAGVVVLELDQRAYDERYGARSPLDRCALRVDLERVYAAGPRLLVVDFDLSPPLWVGQPSPEATRQLECQERLDGVISDRGRTTVLMKPFDVEEPDGEVRLRAKHRVDEWQLKMRAAHVRFGDPEILAEYGLVVRSRVDPKSLVGAAAAVSGRKPSPENGNPWIVPASVRGRVQIVTLGQDLTKLRDRVVFFGGTWDVPPGDSHLTPLGELYGVEIHAGAFASLPAVADDENAPRRFDWLRAPLMTAWRKVRTLCFDLGIALVLGWLALRCWGEYFTQVRRPDAGEYDAAFWVFVLTVLFVAGLCVFVWFSLWLLRTWGIWASPVVVALGVSSECFVLKSVEAAKHLLKHDSGAAVGSAPPAGRGRRVTVRERLRTRIVRRAPIETPAAPSTEEVVEHVDVEVRAAGAGVGPRAGARPVIWWRWVVVLLVAASAVYLE
jgi:CHASE2 domain-containing protein